MKIEKLDFYNEYSTEGKINESKNKINELVDVVNTLTAPKPPQEESEPFRKKEEQIQDEENYKEMEAEIRADEKSHLVALLDKVIEEIGEDEIVSEASPYLGANGLNLEAVGINKERQRNRSIFTNLRDKILEK